MTFSQRIGWRLGMSHPRLTVGLFIVLFVAIAAAAVAGAADWWPQASVPALGLVAGIAVGVLLNVVAWVAWRRDYELSPAFAVPSYVSRSQPSMWVSHRPPCLRGRR